MADSPTSRFYVGPSDHYYHCTLTGIPFTLPLQRIADHVSPQPNSLIVQELESADCHIVPHQLHVYKERLDYKFGFVSYFVHVGARDGAEKTDNGGVHTLMTRWIEEELSAQLLLLHVKVRLAQPPECRTSEPFLIAFRRLCKICTPGITRDPRKIQTFMLTKITFSTLGGNKGANLWKATVAEEVQKDHSCNIDERTTAEDPAEAPAYEWTSVGTYSPADLQPRELLWLKEELTTFPPISVTNGDVKTAHVELSVLQRFFEEHLTPLFTVSTE